MARGYEPSMMRLLMSLRGVLCALSFLGICFGFKLPAGADGRASQCLPEPVFSELEARPELLNLGRDLFYDPILSGNREVACATCHHPALGTSDGLALGIGDGGKGLGPRRKVDLQNLPEQRIPRNAQALFNLGYSEFSVMFHDGRVERLADGRIRTPLGAREATGLLPVLTAQAGFPVLSPDEMAGHYTENEIAKAVRLGLLTGTDGAHDLLAQRISDIPEYVKRFSAIGIQPVQFRDIAMALAVFMAHEWRADDSPYDRHMCSGEPLNARAEAGRVLFNGKAGCAECHAGRFQTDHGFHAIAMPQIGPGKAERFETHSRDVGRMRVTGRVGDAYRFRTPSLRNVALTAPFGHAGAYADLESVIRHHLDPVSELADYTPQAIELPKLSGSQDFGVLTDEGERAAIGQANELMPVILSDAEVSDLIAFLHALTDRAGLEGRLGSPETVPSGLPVPRP